jgi:hypothetical protein
MKHKDIIMKLAKELQVRKKMTYEEIMNVINIIKINKYEDMILGLDE